VRSRRILLPRVLVLVLGLPGSHNYRFSPMGGGSGGGRRSRVGAGAAETGVGPLLPEKQVLY
jgi:hypothetical protein